jgi:hypothetical protein
MIVGSLRSELPVNWAGPITVQPGDRLEWSAKLVSAVDLVPPGKYEVSIVPDTAVGDASSWVVGRPLVLEIREPRGFAGSMELLRRQGMWHYVHDDYGAALASFDELLRRYPESHIAHVMKGNIALRQGDRDRARASYSAALVLLERGADRLYLTERNPPLHIVEEARENVRGMLRGVQRSIR